MARLLGLLIMILEPLLNPVLGRWSAELLARIPAWPFLALTVTGTPAAQSITMAILLAGALGLATMASYSIGGWILLLVAAMVVVMAVGCGRAFATYWWPAALAAAFFGLAAGLSLLPRLVPGALRVEWQSPQAMTLLWGGLVAIWLAFWSSSGTIRLLDLLQQIEASRETRTRDRERAPSGRRRPKLRRRHRHLGE